MSSEESPDLAPKAPQTNRALGAFAAALPFLFSIFACGLFGAMGVVLGRGGLGGLVADMGVGVIASVVGSTGLAALVVAPLLFLGGRGARVPSAMTIGIASTPWLVGLAIGLYSMAGVEEAVAMAEPSTRSLLVSEVISRSTSGRLLGASMGSGLLFAAAFGLACGAIALRAPRRSFLGALLGAAVGLPGLVLSVYALLSTRSLGFALLAAGFGALLATSLGGGGIGADERGRSGALGVAAAIAAGLAVHAAAAATGSASMLEVWAALAGADASSRPEMIVAGAQEMRPLVIATRGLLPGAFVAAGALSGLALVRARPTLGQIAGGAAVALVAVGVAGLDMWSLAHTAEVMREVSREPWSERPGLEWVELRANATGSPPAGYLSPDGLHTDDGERLAGLDEALGPAIANLPRESRPWGNRTREWIVRAEPGLALALDRRVNAAGLRALIRGADAQGVEVLGLVGQSVNPVTEQGRDAVESVWPALAIALETRGSVRCVLESRVREERIADEDPILRHVTVGASAPSAFRTRAGARPAEGPIAEPGFDVMQRLEGPTLYVAIGDEATAESLVATLDAATRAGFVPILVAGAIPGHPELAAGAPVPQDPTLQDRAD